MDDTALSHSVTPPTHSAYTELYSIASFILSLGCMKKGFLLMGMVTITASIIFAKDDMKNLRVEREGEIVKMKIFNIPSSCSGTKIPHFMKVKYNNKIFSKKIGAAYCDEHYIGEEIEMRYLDGSDRVLFPKETVIGEFIAAGLMIMFGLFLIFKGFS